jgi:N-acetylglucosaminyldiphosphoundecaprenol N-acetyl-beta-D-mannosaminyltransferase
MKFQKTNFLNTNINNLSMNETLSIIDEAISNKKQIHHVVVNAGKIVSLQDDKQLRESVNNSDLINADGQAVVWASKILNQPLKERVAGIDLMMNLVQLASERNHKIFLFGAKEEVVSKVAEIYSSQYGKEIIAGYRNGYFKKEEEPLIAKEIADSGAQMLFVAITSPIKENFLYNHRGLLKEVNFIMGVGGSFDVVAGVTKRAPSWMQKLGLEWFYRFLQEPKRMWKRYLIGNSKFILLVLKEKWGIKNKN